MKKVILRMLGITILITTISGANYSALEYRDPNNARLAEPRNSTTTYTPAEQFQIAHRQSQVPVELNIHHDGFTVIIDSSLKDKLPRLIATVQNVLQEWFRNALPNDMLTLGKREGPIEIESRTHPRSENRPAKPRAPNQIKRAIEQTEHWPVELTAAEAAAVKTLMESPHLLEVLREPLALQARELAK